MDKHEEQTSDEEDEQAACGHQMHNQQKSPLLRALCANLSSGDHVMLMCGVNYLHSQ